MASGSTQAGRSGPEERVRLLAEQAAASVQRGDLNQARALYQQLLTLDPRHPEAISFVAMSLLYAGDVRRSVQMLEQAVFTRPDDPSLYKNLGIAYRAAGNPQGALKAFERAAQLKPDLVAAHLNQGALLAELGRHDEALSSYVRGFEAAEANGLYLDVAAIPAGIRVLAEKAIAASREARLEVFHRALAPLEREHGRAALDRVWHCLDSYLGMRPTIELPKLQARGGG